MQGELLEEIVVWTTQWLWGCGEVDGSYREKEWRGVRAGQDVESEEKVRERLLGWD